MFLKITDLITKKMTSTVIIITSIIVFLCIMIVLIIQSNSDEELSILQSGFYETPIIRNDSLQELGKLYSKLNEEFETEINDLTTGSPNRHNKSDNRINPITHYGVYGEDNPNPFKNDYYKNGIHISYEKSTISQIDAGSNFNDIIAVMAVLYDQQMDTKTNDELSKTFEKLFWLSHTYTYYSSELYPCKYGCSVINKYKCSDVYNDYKNTNLKYSPFTVMPHELYAESGYEEDDFRLVYPSGQCEVCGEKGAGCEKDESKICYHGSGNIVFDEYDNATIEGYIYASLGSINRPKDISEDMINDEEIGGNKISKNNVGCRNNRDVRYCKKREDLSKNIESINKKIESKEKELEKLSEKDEVNESEVESIMSDIEDLNKEIEDIKKELDDHILNECESDEIKKMFWCDGFKVCMGHKTHFKCPNHKLIVCYGHTDINVSVKIMNAKEILDNIYNANKEIE